MSFFPLSTLHNQILDEGYCFNCGDEGFNRLIYGGIFTGEITEIVGPSTSGKTQFCLMLSVFGAVNQNINIVYIDTYQSIKPQRFTQIYQNHLWTDTSNPWKLAASNIYLQSVSDIYQLLSVLSDIEQDIINQHTLFARRIRIIIIDSISILISPHIVGSSGQYRDRALIHSLCIFLKHLATTYQLSIIVTSHTVSIDKKTDSSDSSLSFSIKPSLGHQWTYFADTRIFLRKKETIPYRQATLVKSNKGQIQKWTLNYEIYSGGLCTV